MKEGLALAAPAIQIARGTMLLQLRDMAADGAPSLNLPKIVGMPAARVIAAIPLEPAARIVGMNPSFFAPNLQRLRSVDAEIIQARPRAIRRKFRARKPTRRKFLPAIGHVFPPEYAQRQQLLRAKLGVKSEAKFPPHRLRSPIHIILLHFVTDDDAHRVHALLL